jgi:hypothetical protein
MMAKSPADRFDRPDELRDELSRVLTEHGTGQSRFVRAP